MDIAVSASTHHFFHNGHRLAYTTVGSGHTVLFLHNGGGTKEIWVNQVTALQDRYEVICLDQLGFGESDMPPTGYAMSNYVDTLAAFISHLGVDRLSIVGNCMGSAMALLLAERQSEKIASLVLFNPLSAHTAGHGGIGPLVWIARRFPRFALVICRRFRLPRIMTRFAVSLQHGPRHWLRTTIKPSDGARTVSAGWATRGRMTSMAEMFSDPEPFRHIDRMTPGPEFPALAVVWGGANVELSARAGQKLNRTLKPVRSDVLARCGHLAMMEDPETSSKIIADFVDEFAD